MTRDPTDPHDHEPDPGAGVGDAGQDRRTRIKVLTRG
jgi:hypothetical protein